MLDDEMKTDMDRLRADLARVREDVARLAGVMGGLAAEKLRTLRMRAAAKASEDVRSAAEKVSTGIDAYPVAALLTAFGTGLVLGRLFGRRCDSAAEDPDLT